MPELTYNSSATALQMANAIFGDGVTVVGASYTGDARSSATYADGDTISPGVVPGDTGVILSTGVADQFTRNSNSSNTNASTSTTTNTSGPNNNAAFNALAGANTYDAAFLDVDFIPTGDTMTMQFVFSSEEYPEFVNSIYNDMVGVWVNGSPVSLAVGTGNTSVGNVSPLNNINLYNDNTGDAYNTEMDGFTVTMTLKMAVVPGVVNSIRIGIADVGDSSYDSNLLIAGNSVQTALIAHDDTVDVFPTGSTTVDVLANDTGPGGSALFITHINGIAVNPGDSVVLTTGQTVTLNLDGTLTITGDGDTETVNFTYTVANGGGNGLSDTAFVTVNSIPCFVAGTLISTPDGERRVEDLKPGDLVLTHDQGPQPVRWVGRRTVSARGEFAPIRIAAGTFGMHRTIRLSPLHRVLLRDAMAEVLFGEPEVLVAARDLVNDHSVRRVEAENVDYVHVLFDRHQVIYSEGLATESFLPGPQTCASFEAEMVAEICSIFPEIDPRNGRGYSAAARRTLRSFEANVLLQTGRAA
ncbi:MAG: choice-of-anchor L domain-containing protein [Paracoccaceae bacterium]